MKRRLALACARGWRQESLVNELLTGSTFYRSNAFGVLVGVSEVGWQSFVNLRHRLIGVGFIFKMESHFHRGKISMAFPEEDWRRE